MMLPSARSRPFIPALCAWLAAGLFLASGAPDAAAKSCVWKVTAADGHTAYIAGSVHALRQQDMILPAAYDEALRASDALAFETTLGTPGERWSTALNRAGRLPKGVTLKDRVDPRTYAYLLRLVAQVKGSMDPEKKIANLRPWAVAFMLRPEGFAGVRSSYGVDTRLEKEANKARKPTECLVPFKEHIDVFGAMSDRDGELYLLQELARLNTGSQTYTRTVEAWKKGDIGFIDRQFDADYQDAPSVRQRLLTERNLRWLPKIEGYLRTRRTWMVVAGAGHMAGKQGLPALLEARGYKVEQM